MNLDEVKLLQLDSALERYTEEIRSAGDETAAVTLAYTHSIHKFWRAALRMLPVAPHWSVLDVGTGLGILPFELAAHEPVQVEGVDIEPGFIAHAEVLKERLAAEGLFTDGADIGFSVGDIGSLEFEDESFDLVFVREVFQFVPDPEQACRELHRVLRPGAYACVSDMDDQLRITWPPANPVLDRLVSAVAEVQHSQGGDREVGRKLTTYLRAAGFEINSLVVLPEAQHRVVQADDAERLLILEQVRAARGRVLAAGAMDAASFDADLAALEQQDPYEEFRMTARIVVLGQRP